MHAMYGKQTGCAIAAVSRLAEVYDDGVTRVSATEIADVRGHPRPMVAKILSVLSQAGIVKGSPGPGGGFTLARDPAEIRLHDVFRLFEREEQELMCPFGGGICGQGEPCALHDRLAEVRDAMHRLLHETTFEAFRRTHLERDPG
jgi:Rrf2 family iron-sulfur cluster assembly transcriptional regulator